MTAPPDYAALVKRLLQTHEQCTADGCVYKEAADAIESLAKDAARLRKALKFYADGLHFSIAGDPSLWDTVSGEPPNFWCDEAGSATMEDGSVAKMAMNEPDKFDALDWEDAAIDRAREQS